METWRSIMVGVRTPSTSRVCGSDVRRFAQKPLCNPPNHKFGGPELAACYAAMLNLATLRDRLPAPPHR